MNDAKADDLISPSQTPLVTSTDESSSIDEQEFRKLVDEWLLRTGFYSSIDKKIEHPTYRRIVAIGAKAIPWILKELRDSPSYWFTALREISGQDPVERPSSFAAAREAWLAWGRKRGDLQ